MSKVVYQTDADGIFIGTTLADESPLEPGTYLIPFRAYEVEPPALNENQVARWYVNKWIVEPKPGSNVDSNGDPLPPTQDELLERVKTFREEILANGFDYDFGDARGVHSFATTEEDMKGWEEVAKLANALSALGDNISKIDILTETGPVQVTAQEWAQILVYSAATHRQPVWLASFQVSAKIRAGLITTFDEVITDESWNYEIPA